MLIVGDYVRIKNREEYNGQIGKLKGYTGLVYKIELKTVKKIIYCEESEIEKISEDDIEEEKIFYNFSDGDKLELRDQDLRTTCDCLTSNRYFRGLYTLGKYYPKWSYEEEFRQDYFSQQIMRIKSRNSDSAKEISKIYLYFIEKSEILRKIVEKVKYIVPMPNINYPNHVKYWGDILIKKLQKIDLSDYFYVSPEKKKDLSYYKSKQAWQREKIINGAYNINKAKGNFPSLHNESCLILDDICTTGNQINELTNTLVKENIKETFAFVIGRTKS